MQEDVRLNCRSWHVPHALRQIFHCQWMLLFSLLFTGCGGREEDTPHVVSSPARMAALQKAPSGPSQLGALNASPEREKSPPSAVTEETADPLMESASLAQLSALPHLSSLSDHEKAGLLMLLPSRSSSQRLALINMYPSLVKLPVQQKQVLLDRLEKIVPVMQSQRQ